MPESEMLIEDRTEIVYRVAMSVAWLTIVWGFSELVAIATM
jgi:hypothetical protein